jgi:hypothetical protein
MLDAPTNFFSSRRKKDQNKYVARFVSESIRQSRKHILQRLDNRQWAGYLKKVLNYLFYVLSISRVRECRWFSRCRYDGIIARFVCIINQKSLHIPKGGQQRMQIKQPKLLTESVASHCELINYMTQVSCITAEVEDSPVHHWFRIGKLLAHDVPCSISWLSRCQLYSKPKRKKRLTSTGRPPNKTLGFGKISPLILIG